MDNNKKGGIFLIAALGIIIIAIIFIFGTIWMVKSATTDTENAVRSVSLLYLKELASRRGQVISTALDTIIHNTNSALSLISDEDLKDVEHLQQYQSRMKKLYTLEKFAFVDSEGLIYTSLGTRTDIASYSFDYNNLSEQSISIKNLKNNNKKVIIALPINIKLQDKKLVVCFVEIDMSKLLKDIALHSDNNSTTFCNIYTSEGIALTNLVLGGLASEDNLLEALKNANYESGSTYEKTFNDFANLKSGYISFTYNDIKEILNYEPIKGTDWLITYLIRESVINEKLQSVAKSTIQRSLIQSFLASFVLIFMFIIIIKQSLNTVKLNLEKETADAENRIRQQELEQRLDLQEKLLEQEKLRVQSDNMINALASDYRSIYYVNLDDDEGVCIRNDNKVSSKYSVGDHFNFKETLIDYANNFVDENYREGFLNFVDPSNIKIGLTKELILVYRYLVKRNGKDSYEMLRIASVNRNENNGTHIIGAGFTDIDTEMRNSLAKSQALSEALKLAEQASKAKTAFLSNMSHEIRTPMNAIIGLDSIALHDPNISDQTKDYLSKIGTSAQHLLSLINDILDMSRIESGRMSVKNEEFSFSKLVEQINTIFSGQCSEKGLNYSCILKGDIDEFYIGDSIKLRQILINILGNAVKFTPKDGKIELAIEKTNGFDNKSVFKFSIKDNGIGMSKDYLPKIFESFSQEDSSTVNKYGSTGLGMAITKNLVDLLGGNIEVESEKGVGTTFFVTLTLLDSRNKKAGKDKDDIDTQKLDVLVVDNDSITCDHAKLALEKAGIPAEFAMSGKEAIEKVKIRKVRREPYNLIVIDWKMPEMDGVETTRQIKSIVGDDSTIIILSAYNCDDILQEAISAGVEGFVIKPLFVSNLIEEYATALKRKKNEVIPAKIKTDLRGKRILLAEDISVNAEIMILVLHMREMIVDHAENGKIAVEKFESHEAGYYDAILMDMRMPVMDGLEATKAIRNLNKEDSKSIPIIALTANAFDEDVKLSLQAGLNAHLSKPIQPELLIDILENMIPEKGNKNEK